LHDLERMGTRVSSALLAGLSTVALAAAGCVADVPEEVAAGGADAVQFAPLSTHFDVVTTDMTGPVAEAQRATGALLVPRRSPSGDDSIVTAPDGTTIRSTCGVTFIDRTHAITAAHCTDEIDIPDPSARTVTVELYDVAPEVDWRSAAAVSGTFPDYSHPALAGTPGYVVTPLECVVEARCTYGTYRCPEPALSDGADIALLRCDPLPADREPVAVAEVDDTIGPVKAFWFHEVYDAPVDLPPRLTPEYDLYLHYTRADSTGAQNLHYFGDGRNDLLPLVSTAWPTGVERRRLGRSGTVVWTDIFACHGTSGSGVMQLDPTTNKYVLLGPVATASPDWGSDRLCANVRTIRQGRAAASYTALEYTRAMAKLASESSLAPETSALE
jgi:hypothetical protein